MTAKYRKARKIFSLSSKKEKNYKSDIKDKMNPDYTGNDKNSMQL